MKIEKYRGQTVALVVPCYNEALTIADVVKDFSTALPGIEIYVFDNRSTDNTSEIAQSVGASCRPGGCPATGGSPADRGSGGKPAHEPQRFRNHDRTTVSDVEYRRAVQRAALCRWRHVCASMRASVKSSRL